MDHCLYLETRLFIMAATPPGTIISSHIYKVHESRPPVCAFKICRICLHNYTSPDNARCACAHTTKYFINLSLEIYECLYNATSYFVRYIYTKMQLYVPNHTGLINTFTCALIDGHFNKIYSVYSRRCTNRVNCKQCNVS